MAAEASRARLPCGNDFDRGAEFFAGKRTQAAIERRQHALSSVCESQQVGVSEVLIALQPGLQSLHGRRNSKTVRPEFVSGMGKILAEQRECS